MKTPPSWITLLLLLSASASSAIDVSVKKLYGQWAVTPTGFRMGYPDFGPQMIACSEKWIVAGASRATERAVRQGVAQVFNATTGAWVRRLVVPGSTNGNAQLGASCAISGDLAIVSAPGESSNAGAVYVFNLLNGSIVRRLTADAANASANDWFGSAVTVSGNKLIVGAMADDLGKGSCYVFDLKTGAQLTKLSAPGSPAGAGFGTSVASEGDLLLVGAPGVDSFTGAAFLFDLSTLTFVRKVQPAILNFGDGAGFSVALSQGVAVLGAPMAGDFEAPGRTVSVDLFGLGESELYSLSYAARQHLGISVAAHQGQVLIGADDFSGSNMVTGYSLNANAYPQSWSPADTPSGFVHHFGETLALCGNTAVIAAPIDSTQAADAGALYLLRPVQFAMPLQRRLRIGDYAPGAQDITFSSFSDCFMNAEGELAFTGKLGGLGSNAGKDTGGWASLAPAGGIELAMKTRQLEGALAIGAVGKALINRPDAAIFQASLTGTGVTSSNSSAIFRRDATSRSMILRTGTAQPVLGNAAPLSFTQVVQNRGADRVATTCSLLVRAGVTTAATDSALLWYDATNTNTDGVREATAAAATGLLHGQFTGRLASYYSQATYATALTGPVLTNQAVFQKSFGNAEALVAMKNDLAPDAGTARFAAFIGESSDANDTVLFKATLSGDATAANEGLWTRTTSGVTTMVMRKGMLLPGLPAVKIAKFINYWQTAGQTMALVQLSGAGVTTANDQALLLYQTTAPFTGQIVVLLREGDSAPACGTATIGVISRVEVEPRYGHYRVLATLAGAPVGTELILMRGLSAYPSTASEQALRRPITVLRKGTLYENQPSKVKSFALPTTNLTASGAGCTGSGTAIQEPTNGKDVTNLALIVDFDNGVRQLMTGKF